MSCSRALLSIALVCVLGTLPTRVAHADWKRDYDLGVRAVEAGKWAEAETLMRSALASESKPDARKRFQGTVVKAYVPHYYAGLAAYRQGRCEVAIQYWRNGDNAAVVAGLSDLNAVQSRGVADCTQKLAATQTAPAPVRMQAQTQAQTPTQSQPQKQSVVSTTSTPGPGSTAQRGTPADKKPEPARTTSNPVAQVNKTATPSRTTTIRAPDALATAVDDYLAGRYQKVIQFDPAAVADGRSRAQAYLLRAAARFTQANLDDTGVQALAVVRQDVRAARAANANLTPDEVVFSPRFRELWKQTR